MDRVADQPPVGCGEGYCTARWYKQACSAVTCDHRVSAYLMSFFAAGTSICTYTGMLSLSLFGSFVLSSAKMVEILTAPSSGKARIGHGQVCCTGQGCKGFCRGASTPVRNLVIALSSSLKHLVLIVWTNIVKTCLKNKTSTTMNNHPSLCLLFQSWESQGPRT